MDSLPQVAILVKLNKIKDSDNSFDLFYCQIVVHLYYLIAVGHSVYMFISLPFFIFLQIIRRRLGASHK